MEKHVYKMKLQAIKEFDKIEMLYGSRKKAIESAKTMMQARGAKAAIQVDKELNIDWLVGHDNDGNFYYGSVEVQIVH